MFFRVSFLDTLFHHFSNMVPKNMILGTPSGSSSAQNGTRNLAKSCARSPGVTRRAPLLAFLDTPSGPEASRIDSDGILIDFGLIFGRFLVDFLAIWIKYWLYCCRFTAPLWYRCLPRVFLYLKCFSGVLEPTFFPNRFRLNCYWCLLDLLSIWDRVFAIWIKLLMDLLLFWDTFFGQMSVFFFVNNKQTSFWQNLQRSAKICQDHTRSTNGTVTIHQQAPLAETDHESPGPKNEGSAVSRRMASSTK